MCWLAFIAKDKEGFTKQEYNNAWNNNSDGGGYMYAKDNKLFIEKGFVSFEDFWDSYQNIDNNVPRVVHFRKASVGSEQNMENCHPFKVNNSVAFAHNGTIKLGDDDLLDDKIHSDTWFLNEHIIKPMAASKEPDFMWKNEYIHWLLMRVLDKGKVIFLNRYGRHLILNAQEGWWRNSDKKSGVWHSNYSHNYSYVNKTTTGYSSNSNYQHIGTENDKKNVREDYWNFLGRVVKEYFDERKINSELENIT